MPPPRTGSAEPANTGTLRRTPAGFFAQFSIGGDERRGTTLVACGHDETAAKRRQAAIAKLVARLRESGHRAMCTNMIRDAGALDEDGMRKLARLVERIATGKEPGLAQRHTARREGITIKELADLWTSGDLARDYPDHVRVKKTIGDDERQLGWLSKIRMPDGSMFGARAVASVTLDDCDHVMGALPKTAETPASRRHYAQSLRRLLVYAVYPLRLLPALPDPEGLAAKRRERQGEGLDLPERGLRAHAAPRDPDRAAPPLPGCSFARAFGSARRSRSRGPTSTLSAAS